MASHSAVENTLSKMPDDIIRVGRGLGGIINYGRVWKKGLEKPGLECVCACVRARVQLRQENHHQTNNLIRQYNDTNPQ